MNQNFFFVGKYCHFCLYYIAHFCVESCVLARPTCFLFFLWQSNPNYDFYSISKVFLWKKVLPLLLVSHKPFFDTIFILARSTIIKNYSYRFFFISVLDLKTTFGHHIYIFCQIYMNFDMSHSTVYEKLLSAQDLRLSISVEPFVLESWKLSNNLSVYRQTKSCITECCVLSGFHNIDV